MRDSLDINEWIRFAQMDYDAANNMAILHNPVPLEIVCFHCQQSAEKILKAYILAQAGALKKTMIWKRSSKNALCMMSSLMRLRSYAPNLLPIPWFRDTLRAKTMSLSTTGHDLFVGYTPAFPGTS